MKIERDITYCARCGEARTGRVVEMKNGLLRLCDSCAAELAKQLTTPAEDVPEELHFVEQRIGIKDDTAWRAFRDGGDSRYPWRIFIKGQIPCEASDKWMAENYPATETLSPILHAARIAELEAEVANLKTQGPAWIDSIAAFERIAASWASNRKVIYALGAAVFAEHTLASTQQATGEAVSNG